jgi:hypothetical protein
MTALADMTEEERAQCRGMWCEDEDGRLCIYRADHRGPNWLAVCIYPDRVGVIAAKYDLITPRPDLPRAWTPDGTPPAGKWEHAEHLSKGVTTVYLCGKENSTRRRWIGEWEEA